MPKKLSLSAIAGVLLFATSVSGQTGPQTSAKPLVRAKPKPPTTQLPALSTKLPNTVHEGGHKYLGRDPSPEIRYQIMKDETMHKGNNY